MHRRWFDGECFAVAAICSKYNVPVLGIRVISDNGLVTKVEDEQMDSDEFYEKVCHLERAYVLNVVRAIVRLYAIVVYLPLFLWSSLPDS